MRRDGSDSFLDVYLFSLASGFEWTCCWAFIIDVSGIRPNLVSKEAVYSGVDAATIEMLSGFDRALGPP